MIRIAIIVAVLLALLGGDCTDECVDVVAVTEVAAVSAVNALCDTEGQICVGVASTQLAHTDGSVIYFSPPLCADDLPLCRFAVWHEIGHVRLGASELGADCFAAQNAEPDDVDAAICYFDRTTFVGGDTGHGSGPERADRIEACR